MSYSNTPTPSTSTVGSLRSKKTDIKFKSKADEVKIEPTRRRGDNKEEEDGENEEEEDEEEQSLPKV